MKIIILGASGMAGEMITKWFKNNTTHEILPVCRTNYYGNNFIANILDKQDMTRLVVYIKEQKPDIVINCIGLLISESEKNLSDAMFVNGAFPKAMASLCTEIKSKFIHISTDCVFDGLDGPYNEYDEPNEANNYGSTKAMGEVKYKPHLTLRTSIIGPDSDTNGTGLFNWLLYQYGIINGFTGVMWNGITTLELAKQINKIITECPTLSGLYHLTTDYPITKFNLLMVIKMVFKKSNLLIVEDATKVCNKCLINNRKAEYQPDIPPIPQQITQLHDYIISA